MRFLYARRGPALPDGHDTTGASDPLAETSQEGAEVYYADLELRAHLPKANSRALPEAKRKIPTATADAFDWTAILPGVPRAHPGASINCWAYAALSAFEYNWAIRNGGPLRRWPCSRSWIAVSKNGSYYSVGHCRTS